MNLEFFGMPASTLRTGYTHRSNHDVQPTWAMMTEMEGGNSLF